MVQFLPALALVLTFWVPIIKAISFFLIVTFFNFDSETANFKHDLSFAIVQKSPDTSFPFLHLLVMQCLQVVFWPVLDMCCLKIRFTLHHENI